MTTREELTRQAEKCLRQGRLVEAIAQYQELAHLEPVDWGLVKQLADLLERAGQREGAARQFARWADHLFGEGFHSKSAALYKKVLKLEPADEHALWQLGEVSLELKLRADARLAFQRVAELRQRRGDAVGAAAARDRLSSFEIAPTGASAAPPTPPAYLAPATSPGAVAPTPAAVAAAAPPAHGAEGPGVPMPAASPLPSPTSVAPTLLDVSASPTETRAARLAGLRREAEDADHLGRPDADDAWHAVLEIDPEDDAVRRRLVLAACDSGAFEKASDLAASLDAAADPALVVLLELAHRSGRTDVVDRLIASRVQAGAGSQHVLAPVETLAERHPGAARAALASAVAAWVTAGQSEHAVAALEHAHARAWLTTALYLKWVDVCVDADLPSLSRAQHALAGAYLSDDRLHEARAVAEDLFVRDGGAEPSRSLLLDVLAREGVQHPHRILTDLLAPPSESVDEAIPDYASPLSPAAPHADDRPQRGESVLTAPAAAVFDWADLLGRDVHGARAKADVVAQPDASPFTDTGAAALFSNIRTPSFFEEAPLQPALAIPQAWLRESPRATTSDEPPPRAPEDDFLFPVEAAWPPASSGDAPVGALTPRTNAEADHADPEQAPLQSPDSPDSHDPPDLPGSSSEAAGVVEEEIDLTQLLEELKQWDPLLPEPLARPADAQEENRETDHGPPRVEEQDGDAALLDGTLPTDSTPSDGSTELDAVFADLYRHTDDRAVAEQQLAAGRVFLAAGLVAEAARAFERASLAPRSRFDASLALAELHRSRGQVVEAVGWYEQATTAAVPDAAVKRAVLYDLAESLEALGENDRALGVLLDLLSQVEDYRDARARLDRLLRVDAGG